MARKMVWLIILALSLGVWSTGLSTAQDGPWIETFDDPALPGWEHSPGVTVVDGALRIESGNFAARGGNWTDFTLNMRLRRVDGEGNLLVEYRATDAASNYLRIHGSGFALGRNVSGQEIELQRSPVGAPATDWFDLILQVSGRQHSVLFNNQPIINLTEDGEPLPLGGLILHANGVTVEVDQMTLNEGVALPPASPTQSALPSDQVATNVPGVWVPLGGPPGGLGYDIRMNPDNPDIMYVTDAIAGVHKSIDGGHTWFPVNTGITQTPTGDVPIFSLTIDPHNHDTIWAGTQNIGHIYRSTDAGQTWQLRDNGIVREGRSVRGITIDPNNPNIVYVGAGVMSSAWYGEPLTGGFDLTMGEVYKSTDAGESWVRIWQGNNLARYVWVDPRNSNRLYVSTGLYDRDAADSNIAAGIGGGVGVLRSDDGGQTWTVLNEAQGLGGRYVPSLFMHPQNPDILLASTTYLSAEHGVWVTRDGGDTWERVLDPGRPVEAVEIATSNPNVWYAGAEDTIWRSDDAGQTWQQFPVGSQHMKPGLPIDLQVDPRDPYRLFINNYGGGNVLSGDGGETWVHASQGYTGLKLFGTIAVAPDNPNLIIAGAFRSLDGGDTWEDIEGGNGAGLAFYPTPGGSGYGIIATDQAGRILHSVDHGDTWQSAWLVNLTAELDAGRIDRDSLLSRSLAVAPSDPNRVYVGFVPYPCVQGGADPCFERSGDFYRSDDNGHTWAPVSNPCGGTAILSVAVHPTNPDTLFVGAATGVFRSNDGGQSWQAVQGPTIDLAQLSNADIYVNPLNPVIVYHVIYDPFDANVLYAATVPGGVWRSVDGGQTWQQTAAGMDPNEPVYEIVADPHRPGVLYASSGLSGVFYTTDGGQMWLRISEGLTNTNVRGLGLSPDGLTLYAGTIGRGVFRLNTSSLVGQ